MCLLHWETQTRLRIAWLICTCFYTHKHTNTSTLPGTLIPAPSQSLTAAGCSSLFSVRCEIWRFSQWRKYNNKEEKIEQIKIKYVLQFSGKKGGRLNHWIPRLSWVLLWRYNKYNHINVTTHLILKESVKKEYNWDPLETKQFLFIYWHNTYSQIRTIITANDSKK